MKNENVKIGDIKMEREEDTDFVVGNKTIIGTDSELDFSEYEFVKRVGDKLFYRSKGLKRIEWDFSIHVTNLDKYEEVGLPKPE